MPKWRQRREYRIDSGRSYGTIHSIMIDRYARIMLAINITSIGRFAFLSLFAAFL